MINYNDASDLITRLGLNNVIDILKDSGYDLTGFRNNDKDSVQRIATILVGMGLDS